MSCHVMSARVRLADRKARARHTPGRAGPGRLPPPYLPTALCWPVRNGTGRNFTYLHHLLLLLVIHDPSIHSATVSALLCSVLCCPVSVTLYCHTCTYCSGPLYFYHSLLYTNNQFVQAYAPNPRQPGPARSGAGQASLAYERRGQMGRSAGQPVSLLAALVYSTL